MDKWNDLALSFGIYLDILGTFVLTFLWLGGHSVFYDEALDRFGQSLVAYLFGLVSVLARPHLSCGLQRD